MFFSLFKTFLVGLYCEHIWKLLLMPFFTSKLIDSLCKHSWRTNMIKGRLHVVCKPGTGANVRAAVSSTSLWDRQGFSVWLTTAFIVQIFFSVQISLTCKHSITISELIAQLLIIACPIKQKINSSMHAKCRKQNKTTEGMYRGSIIKWYFYLEEQAQHFLPSRNEAVAFSCKHYLSLSWTDRLLSISPSSWVTV